VALVLTTAPGSEPLTTAEAKAHLRVDLSDDDTLIDGLIAAARAWAERFTRRAFVTQTWTLYADAFPGSNAAPIRLPKPPIQSVDSIIYVDSDGASQTWNAANYTLDSKSEPGRVLPAYNQVWPVTRSVPNAVAVQYIAGYGGASAVPQAIKQAILLLVGHWYAHRESVAHAQTVIEVPQGVEALLWAYRV
jgi:uncharacterized phiE125 gp8 family phage protein